MTAAEGSDRPEQPETVLRDLADSIPGSLYRFRCSVDGVYSFDYMTEGLRALAGFSDDVDLCDFALWQHHIPSDHVEGFMESIEASRAALTPWHAEWPVDVPAGRLWLQGMSQPHVDANGEVVWNGLLLDITARKRAEQEFERAELHYRSLFEHTTEGVYRCSPTGKLLEVNEPLVRIHRCTSKDALLEATADIARDWYVDTFDRERLLTLIERNGAAEDFETTCYRVGTGETFRSRENARAIRADDGTVLFYQSTIRDVTAQHRAQRLADARTAILERIARGDDLGLILYEVVGTLERYHGRNTSAILRLHEEYIEVAAAPALAPACIDALQDRRPDQLGGAIAAARNVTDACLNSEHTPRAGAGENLAAAMSAQGYGEFLAVPIRDQQGTVNGFLVVFTADTSQVDDALRRVAHEMAQIAAIAFDQDRLVQHWVERAQYDALTKLPNRVLLADRMQQLVREAERHGHPFAVLLLDLDGFKPINDTLGHQAGDALLCEVAERFQACVRGPDTVARLGGDEFVVALPLDEPHRATDVAERINAALEQGFTIAGQALTIRASIGIAVYPGDGASADTLLQAADEAMYAAKRSRQDYYCYADRSSRSLSAD